MHAEHESALFLFMCVCVTVFTYPTQQFRFVVFVAVTEPQCETDKSVCAQLQRNLLEKSQYTQQICSYQSQLAAAIVIFFIIKTILYKLIFGLQFTAIKIFNKQQTNSPCITPTIRHANSIEFV